MSIFSPTTAEEIRDEFTEHFENYGLAKKGFYIDKDLNILSSFFLEPNVDMPQNVWPTLQTPRIFITN